MIPSSSREALFGGFRNLSSMNDVVEAFQAAGTTQPVRLTDSQKRLLLNLISFWADQIDSEDDLPEGISDLRQALHDASTTSASRRRTTNPVDAQARQHVERS